MDGWDEVGHGISLGNLFVFVLYAVSGSCMTVGSCLLTT